jgi:DNA-binding NarL/FixJ family response regulator
MSDAQIADALVVAETTVKTHVARILAELDVREPEPGRAPVQHVVCR